MLVFLICLASFIIALSALAKLNDLPRKGQHIMKLGLAICGASAILIAMSVFVGKMPPLWLITASLIGCALDKLVSSPLAWWRWIIHGERRQQPRLEQNDA